MSGIEIAGLVLGAIPVLIQTLKICGKGLSAYRKSRMYENELERIICKLENERVRIQDACEKLLVDLVPPSRIERLLEDPLSLAHEEPGLQRKLERRLWKGYNTFQATLRDVKAAIDVASGRIETQTRSSNSDFRKALRRSFMDDLLFRINEGVSTIEDIINRNMDLEPHRKCRFQGRFLRIIRTVAGGLHRAVRVSLSCQCEHNVCLQLDQQTCNITPADKCDDRVVEEVEFRLALSYHGGNLRSPAFATPNWVDILAKPTPKKQPLNSDTSASILCSDTKHDKLVPFKERLRKLFSTTADSPVSPSSMNLQAVSVDLGQITQQPQEYSGRLNLCEMMRQPGGQRVVGCYGEIVECATGPTASYTVYPIPSKYQQRSNRVITSLNEILGQNQRCMLLSEQDRLQLAVVLSSSLLQLYGSPWVPTVMRSHDVYLVQGREDPICDRFFVLQSFPHNENKDKEATDPTFPRNQTLFYLGILLIELGLGKSFELLQTDGEQSKPYSKSLKDYMTAKRLLHQVNSLVGPSYGSAVARCLDDHGFHETDVGLENESLSHDVYSGVVALLEQELKNSTF